MIRSFLQILLVSSALSALFANPAPTQAIGIAQSELPAVTISPDAELRVSSDIVRRVFVKNVLDLPVVQQPENDAYAVSDRYGEITQFGMASQYGNIGLLAHNTLAGKHFSKLTIGQEVRLRYSDWRVEYFVIEQILRFQALEPESVLSTFSNLDSDEEITAGELFNQAYVGDRRLVFQTCIAARGNVSWGRLFVIAVPKK